jgi:hypothetical protein
MDLVCRDALRHYGPGRRNGTLAELNARPDYTLRPRPRAIPQLDGLHNQAERCVAQIVIAGAKIRALGDACVIADGNLLQIIEPAILTNPCVIAQ